MYWVDDNLFNQIKVRKPQELNVAGCIFLDKVLASIRCVKLLIVIAKLMMLLIDLMMKHYKRQTVKHHSIYGPSDLPPS